MILLTLLLRKTTGLSYTIVHGVRACVGRHSSGRISEPNHFKFGVRDPWAIAPDKFVSQPILTTTRGTFLFKPGQQAAVS